MPATKAQPTRKAASTRGPRPAKGTGARFQTRVERTTELSEEVLESIERSQRAALEAVRKFADKVDEALPPQGPGASRREEVIDAALDMAGRLVKVQYDFLHNVVESAGKSLGVKPHAGKK